VPYLATEEEATEEVIEETAEEEKEPVKIAFWYTAAEGDETDVVYRFHHENAELFMEANPHVEIEEFILGGTSAADYRAKVLTEAAAGYVPDMFMTWHGGSTDPLVDAGLLMPLDDIVANDPELKETVDYSKLSLAIYDGVLYGMIDTVDAIGFFYNKAILNEYNLEVPETYEDLLQVSKTLQENDVVPMALGLSANNWMGSLAWQMIFMQQNSLEKYQTDIMGNNIDYTEQPYIDAMKPSQDLALSGYYGDNVNSIGWSEMEAMFLEGKTAFLLCGTWFLNKYYDELGEDLGYMTFPSVDGNAPSYMVAASKGFALSKEAPQEAVDFLKFTYSRERQAKYAEMGVFISLVDVDYDSSVLPAIMGDINNQLANSKKTFIIWGDMLPVDINPDLFSSIQEIMAGEDIAEMMAYVQELNEGR
jgi:ABC-type glycerol-3-phosphate transport system substrate-binding protein